MGGRQHRPERSTRRSSTARGPGCADCERAMGDWRQAPSAVAAGRLFTLVTVAGRGRVAAGAGVAGGESLQHELEGWSSFNFKRNAMKWGSIPLPHLIYVRTEGRSGNGGSFQQ